MFKRMDIFFSNRGVNLAVGIKYFAISVWIFFIVFYGTVLVENLARFHNEKENELIEKELEWRSKYGNELVDNVLDSVEHIGSTEEKSK